MKKTMITLSMLLLAGVAQAQVPDFSASCPGNIKAHAESGVVSINGKNATVKKFSPTYYEAKSGKTTLSIMNEGGLSISYTVKHGGNGICQTEQAAVASTAQAAYNGSNSQTKPAEKACLKAVAKESGAAQNTLVIDYVAESQAATGVDIKVANDAKLWRCVSDAQGHVQGISRG
ncbi:hypothetical protein [Aeromonas sp. sia0103]|jgi:hypothetical protein|uniref:hypothetical protein n=1 Tax=Aeromonas sp. sia0103 TaxID=2854782 RepID=UPI001C43AE90|nr:hypothetical protein [Aeromonas sp. sia0103]MBV7599011.1 hypothetical protein [Aeromonas sp. sia0103]